jgi:predicted metal-dependent phosphoesterase TrpH
MKVVRKICFLALLLGAGSVAFGAWVRREVKIPDVLGYETVKCDFHIHTVFSDGAVWPYVRSDEAWREGLDAFAITDHIKNRKHEADLRLDNNRSYEIAKPGAEALGLTIIRGGEISRHMPPGHFNAIFLKDVSALNTEEWRDAIKAAVEQGGFVFWNHPGWEKQAPEGKSVWYAEHTELYEKGWLHGIEVVNGDEYYPLAHKWAMEKKLAMIGNSDVHYPVNMLYEFHEGEHRTITLVLAKDKSKAAIKEALMNRRTVVYRKNMLIGEEKYLRAIFDESVEIINPEVTIKGKEEVKIQIRNKSEVDFELALKGTEGALKEISVPKDITLYGEGTVQLKIKGTSEEFSGKKKMRLVYEVKNLLVRPKEGLREELIINVNFVPVERK